MRTARSLHCFLFVIAFLSAGAQRVSSSAEGGTWQMLSPQEVYRRKLMTLRVEHLREL